MIINDLDRLLNYIYYLKKYRQGLENDKNQINRSLVLLGKDWEDRIYDRISYELGQLTKIIQKEIVYFDKIINKLNILAYKIKKYLS